MDILNQEELDALFEVVTEPENTGSDVPSSTPQPSQTKHVTAGIINEETLTFNRIQQKLLTRSPNIITPDEIKSRQKENNRVPAINVINRSELSPRIEIKKSLIESIPFLVLLSELGGGFMNKEMELEVKTRDDRKIGGYFDGFFFDEKELSGGIAIRVAEESVSVNAADIAVSENGEFLVTIKNNPDG